jgi:carbamoyl-phosphate synthase large subunit
MPKRLDLHKILILGSGPIVIGQGCEFDYSGVQACKALKAAGYTVVLVNSNPATIMTDPDLAHCTYIEPITWHSVSKIIEQERPDAILSTMGGQTALNCALELEERGILSKYEVELIGANKHAIKKAEDRELFRIGMQKIGLEMPKSIAVHTLEQAIEALEHIGFPAIIRPSFTLGGSGGGVAYNMSQFEEICERGLSLSMNTQLLIEESLLGWKEFELEVIRDANNSCIIVCTIENIDPMGIHTGDSITVAPAQTLTDKEYQKMRNAAIAILREIGVETGGSNVQFALHPQTGRMIVIEMNPRVSRSSALASKATGFPIAKVAALLAVGYTLDELKNDITGDVIPASFEPSIDYVVVKIPRFNFDKFADLKPCLTTQMQSVGEVMAIGSTFQAAMQKALCSLEEDLDGFNPRIYINQDPRQKILSELCNPSSLRLLYIADAIRLGLTIEQIHEHTKIDLWFLDQICDLVNVEEEIKKFSLYETDHKLMLLWKQMSFSDARLSQLFNTSEADVRAYRLQLDVTPKFKRIDSCAAEFPATTDYLYSSYDGECEARPTNNKKVIVLGSGPNRIGQGIEFDYCCVQAVQALQENGIEAIMINCNPETVSTDYDISNRLYFEALRLETVLDIIYVEQPLGVILQLGGQTPLKLAAKLHENGVKILGTSYETIDIAEDRGKFSKIISKLGLKQPANAMVHDLESALIASNILGYPLMIRPSYVLGGRAMQVVHSDVELKNYLLNSTGISKNSPVLIDCFLQNAKELDVDVVADGQGNFFIAGIMEHIEAAGIHSGDSASVIPPFSIEPEKLTVLKQQAKQLAMELHIIGLMNIQFAIQDNNIYILEVNPRASRTVPFVSKSVGIPVSKIAVACMLGRSLQDLHLQPTTSGLYAVKQSVFPFSKFPGVDPFLGPEMRSTGEVMCFGTTVAEAFQKTQEAIFGRRHLGCAKVFLSVDTKNLDGLSELLHELVKHSIQIYSDRVTQALLLREGVACNVISDPATIIELIAVGTFDFILSTQITASEIDVARRIRASVVRHRINYATTIARGRAILSGLHYGNDCNVYLLQELHKSTILPVN